MSMLRIGGWVVTALGSIAMGDVSPKIALHGAGWLQGGRVESSWEEPEATNDYTKNWLGHAGGVLSIQSQLEGGWECRMGIGTAITQLARGSRGQSAKWYPFWAPWVNEAKVEYTRDRENESRLSVAFGIFPYGYNDDIQNFGQYLMHGYVYPGTLVTSLTGPLGVNQALTGVRASYQQGDLKNDVILKIETEDKPYYDISVADALTWKIGMGFEVGIGVNFYRLLPANADATSPGKDCTSGQQGIDAYKSNQQNTCFILDSIGVNTLGEVVYDTVTGSLSGTKWMGRWRWDPKVLLGWEDSELGKKDLVLYSEVAVLGMENYRIYYNDIWQRIPVMIGWNLPGFGLVDASVEIQYYASKFSGDNLGAQNGVWLPAIDPGRSGKRDDWKYSVNVSKLLQQHILVSGQIANDDLRLGGYHYEPAGKEAMRTPTDWYWAAKIGYFF